jgi:hypothetical protein
VSSCSGVHVRGTYSSDVTKLVFLTSQNLAQDTAHDLTRAGLGKIRNDVNGFGCSEWADALPYLHDQVLAKSVVGLVAVLDGDKGCDCLASKLIGHTDDSSFSDGVVLNQSGLDLSSGQTMTGNVDNVVDTATDPVVPFVVTSSTVTSEVVSLVDIQVCVHISLVCAPDGASHARPCLLEGQNTLDVVAVELLAGDGVDDCGFDTEEGKGRATGLGRGDTSEGGDDVRAGLCLPVCL